MAWTAADRRTYAPAMQEMVRRGMIVRPAQTMDALDPQPEVGRERVWSALIMLQALWHPARDGCTWRRLPHRRSRPRRPCGAACTAGGGRRCSIGPWR